MIADFRYLPKPKGDEVVLKLFWEDGQRMAELSVPPDIEETLTRERLPGVGVLPVESALGYAVALAAQSASRLCLTGDRTVWLSEWGHLLEAN